jgi:orotate phosphoribosyltransferase
MNDIEEVLKRFGVLQEGHFQLASGLHSAQYFQKFRILEHPELVMSFAERIAAHFRNQGITIVCGPTTGGVIIAYEVARQLKTRCVVAEKAEPAGRKIGRGFQISESDRILVVDDVLTTGGSVRDTLEALRGFGGRVVGIGIFIDRSSASPFEIPHFAVYHRAVQNFAPANCPLCSQGVPLSSGH